VAPAEPQGARQGGRGAKEAKKKAPSPDEPPPGEVIIRADSLEQLEKGHTQARGFVDLRAGDVRIQADQADYYETENADGTKSRRVVAERNVVFMRGDERLSGDRAEMDLDTGEGVFENALGFIEPGVYVEGRRIERLGSKVYQVEGGRFTSCAQPNPRWMFSASSARIHVNDKIVAWNVIFKVKSVPAFYLPVIAYPIRHDQRSTGFLFPHFGYSSVRGFTIGSGFFWAMGRSADQTFYADRYSLFGFGLGHELRYVEDGPSRGTFRTYLFKLQDGGPWDYNIDYNALQMLPGQLRATLQVREYSNLDFQARFQDNLNLATTRTSHSAFSVQRNFGSTTFQAVADATDTFFGDQTVVNRHLPTVSVQRLPGKIGHTGLVFGYAARADNLTFGTKPQTESFNRLDVAPDLSRPISWSFLQVTPRVAARYTRYSRTDQVDENGNTTLSGPALNRPLFEGTIDLRGPTFSRVFNNPGGFYSEKIKHVIGPEITWTYRTKVDNFDVIPKFDGSDYLLGTNQVNYALVQRFLAKRPGPSGKLVPYEFLSWRVSQTYYVQIADGQNNFDPNYSSSAFGPSGKPEHFSPVLSKVRFHPTKAFSTDFNVEYDVNFHAVRRLGLNGSLSGAVGSVSAGWSRVTRLSQDPAQGGVVANTLRSSGSLNLLPGRLVLNGSADYDFVGKVFIQTTARLRWDVQCCGFVVETIQTNFNQVVERQFRFAIELANVGSIGNFMGQDAGGQSLGLGGYR
jgi:lipopolysaccharide assembly outer membrane protein LptD (OstA)